jgi:hypothetical protein
MAMTMSTKKKTKTQLIIVIFESSLGFSFWQTYFLWRDLNTKRSIAFALPKCWRMGNDHSIRL